MAGIGEKKEAVLRVDLALGGDESAVVGVEDLGGADRSATDNTFPLSSSELLVCFRE